MLKWMALISFVVAASACASKPKQDEAGLEKYPACYHKNVKLEAKCIELNDGGKPTTALELENAAHPGQYN